MELPSLIGHGLYPLRQVARLVAVEPRTLRRWLKGYSWKYRDGKNSSGPLWSLQYSADEALGPELTFGFRDLLELRVVAKFMAHGVSLRAIRATIEAGSDLFGSYPLQSRRFLTDGRSIFYDAIDRTGDDPRLLDIRRKQWVFNAVVRPSLLDGIDYSDRGDALRWFPVSRSRLVVLDPVVQFGEPIVASAGVPTDTLAAAYLAEGKDRDRVARLYRVTPQEVSAAVSFETRLAA